MDSQDRTVGVKWVAIVGGLVGILAFAGCKSQERFRPDYLSGESRLVGGGLKIEWMAPEPGTVYLVEKKTSKLVQTFTLEAGEPYHFAVESIVDAEELEDLIGISMAKAQFLLYFKPGGERGSTARTGESSRR